MSTITVHNQKRRTVLDLSIITTSILNQIDKIIFNNRKKLSNLSNISGKGWCISDNIVFTDEQIIIPMTITMSNIDTDNQNIINSVNNILIESNKGFKVQLTTIITKSQKSLSEAWDKAQLQVKPKKEKKWQEIYQNLNKTFSPQIRGLLTNSDYTIGQEYILIKKARTKDLDQDLILVKSMIKKLEKNNSNIIKTNFLTAQELEAFCINNFNTIK